MGERQAPILARALTWAVSGKAAAPVKPQNGSHRPSRCHDRDCPRPLCAAYKDGYEAAAEDAACEIAQARAEGWQAGHQAGQASGWAAGYAAGSASASKS
jgi:hypothetical protein